MNPIVTKGPRERYLVEETETRVRSSIAGDLLRAADALNRQADMVLDLKLTGYSERVRERADTFRAAAQIASGGAR